MKIVSFDISDVFWQLTIIMYHMYERWTLQQFSSECWITLTIHNTTLFSLSGNLLSNIKDTAEHASQLQSWDTTVNYSELNWDISHTHTHTLFLSQPWNLIMVNKTAMKVLSKKSTTKLCRAQNWQKHINLTIIQYLLWLNTSQPHNDFD